MAGRVLVAVAPGVGRVERQTEFSAGMDLRCADAVWLAAGERKSVDTGVRLFLPEGTYGRVCPRSGLALKHGLHVLAGVIDADYDSAIRVLLINLGQTPVYLEANSRIAQLVVEKMLSSPALQVLPEELERLHEARKAKVTARGGRPHHGGIGSTGDK